MRNKLSLSESLTSKASETKSLSKEEVQEKFGFELLSSMPLEEIAKIIPELKRYNILPHKNEDKLIVTKISNEVGYGVFSSIKIPSNTIIAEYMGKVIQKKKDQEDDGYTLGFMSDEDYKENISNLQKGFYEYALSKGINMQTISDEEYLNYQEEYLDSLDDITSNKIINISAKYQGNIARFFNHLPNDNEIMDLSQSFQTLNLDKINIQDGKSARLFLFTTKDIEPGEQLGFDYGIGYWKSKGAPKLFEKDTNKVFSQQEVYNKAGIQAYQKKNYKQAINLFNKSLEIEKNSSVYYNLGRAYEEARDYDKATKNFMLVLKLNPDEKNSKIYGRLVECFKAADKDYLAKLFQEKLDNLSTEFNKASISK